jgi:hypothetical protein
MFEKTNKRFYRDFVIAGPGAPGRSKLAAGE